jgi:hypothetical protein
VAGGFILGGSLWARVGPAIVPHLDMKAQSHRLTNYETFAILGTLRAVLDCPQNALSMQ